MFKRNNLIKYYKLGFFDGILFASDFLKNSNNQDTRIFLQEILNNLDYYANEYKMKKKDLKKCTKILLKSLMYFSSS